ncbi:MAG TPA: Tm-1-like ATP-binding domain-containing protein [Gaiellaceae bacterium]|nr:Tm-1-like ATP-binding domain-containing protein [Gaiellaceae bacterium]
MLIVTWSCTVVATSSDAIPGTATVVLLGTLDTKGDEYAFVRDRIAEAGVEVVVVDAGILGVPSFPPDITRQEVAAAAGEDVQALADARDRSRAIDAMGRGSAAVVRRLHAEGRLDVLGALGGTGGTAIATRAMRALPIGVPKLMVSTVASGDTSSYVGTTDVTMMHSVVDVAGINRISARIFENAARALAGLAVRQESRPLPERPMIAASMWGVTTPCVTTARTRLEELGYDVLVFHQTGTGGRSLEALVGAGLVHGVLDVTPTELADELVGGIWPSGPERLETAGRLGIPQVVSLGAIDIVVISSTGLPDPLPERFRGRPIYVHDETVVATRTTPDECSELATVIARKLNAAAGPTVLFVPLRGLSLLTTEGQSLYDPDGDEALLAALREQIDRSKVEVHEIDADLNDPGFALAMATRLHELVTG